MSGCRGDGDRHTGSQLGLENRPQINEGPGACFHPLFTKNNNQVESNQPGKRPLIHPKAVVNGNLCANLVDVAGDEDRHANP